jgi:peroxiredoxin Q/BCP
VARAYGVLASSGYASRWTFYIGADGRILDIEKKVSLSSHGRDIAERVQRAGLNLPGADPTQDESPSRDG